MKRTTAVASLALFVGAAIATAWLRAPEPDAGGTTTSTTGAATPLATWVDDAEIVVPPVVVVPTRIQSDGGLVVVTYDLVGMAGEPAVRPTAWTLLTTGGEITAEVDPAASRVAFTTGFDFDPQSIEGLRLDEYVLRSPIQTWFRPSPTDFSTHAIAPGATAALDIVQEQTDGAIVRVQLRATMPGAVQDLAAEGIGPGWVTASSNFGGGGLWTLSYDGATLPDPLPIRVRGILWIPVETSLVTDLEGVPID